MKIRGGTTHGWGHHPMKLRPSGTLPGTRAPDLFNPKGSWMDGIDPFLLLRFWKSKGYPGTYRMRTPCGIVYHMATPFGVLKVGWDPFLTGTVEL